MNSKTSVLVRTINFPGPKRLAVGWKKNGAIGGFTRRQFGLHHAERVCLQIGESLSGIKEIF